MKKSTSVYIFAGISILCFSLSPTISKYFFNGVDPFAINAWSMIPSTLLFLVILIRNGKIRTFKTIPARHILAMTGIGLTGVFVYLVSLQIGYSAMPGQQAFVINYLWPAMIILWARILLKEKPDAGKWCALLLSFLGVVIVAVNGDFHQLTGGTLSGVIACVVAAVSYGFYSAMSKKMRYDTELLLFLAFLSSMILCFVLAAVRGVLTVPTAFTGTGYLIFGLFTNGIAYLFWLLALENGNTALISNLAYLTPVVSLGLTHVFLGEEITLYSVLGLGIILLGIALQAALSRKQEKGGT